MRGWLVSLRIARREARRAKGRTALVLSLILLPVLALSFAAVTYDMFTLTTAEQLDRELGRFEASANWPFAGEITQDALGYGSMGPGTGGPSTPTAEGLLALLPAGSRVALVDARDVRLAGPTGEHKLRGHQLDLADAGYRGRVSVLRGTAPATVGEIALNASAMELLGVRLGGTLRLPDKGDVRVVAEVEFPDTLKPLAVLRPGTLPVEPPGSATTWLIDAPAPVTWDQVRALNRHGVVVRSRAVVLDPPADAPSWDTGGDPRVFQLGILVFGLGVLEVVLLAGPAFAVGARRRRRELALVAANGGTPAHLRRIVLADGVLLGVVAAVAGTAVAIVAAFALRGVFEEHVNHARAGAYRVYPLALAGIAVLAFVAGVGAALVPAFAAARTDVVAALAGRRNRTGPGRRWLVAGLCTIAAGAAVAGYGVVAIDSTVVMAGLVLAELGLVVCTPTLVGLIARLGRRLPLAPRIAVRDLARNRSSTAPAISAVMAAVLGAVTVAVFYASDAQRQLDMQVQGLPDGYAEITYGGGDDGETGGPLPTQRLVDAATATLPVAKTVELRGATCPPSAPGGWCGLRPVEPVHRRCPFQVGKVTPEQQRKAARDPRCHEDTFMMSGGGNATTIVDDGSTIGLVSAATGDDLARAEATLRAGGVVVADPDLIEDGKVILAAVSADDPEGDRHTVTVPGYLSTTAVSRIFVAISPQAVAKAGLVVQVKGIVVATSRMPTRAEMGAFNAATEALGHKYYGSVAWPYRPDATVTLVVLAIVSGLIALGAAGIATGLAAVDSRPDLATLGAVGASPGVRRRLTLSQAGVIAGLGSLLGAVAGLGAGWAVLAALNRKALSIWPSDVLYPLVVPWPNLAAAVLLVPLVAMVGTALLTRARLPIERRA